MIGGTGLDKNVISTNLLNGIEVSAGAATIANNLIGIGSDGQAPLGNGGAGVFVSGGTGTSITANSIDDNVGLGIDLAPTGVTANDAGDVDTGPNNLQNFPVIDVATQNGVTGTLSSAAGTYTIEIFTSPSCDASGNGEGATLLNTTNMNVGATGTGNWGIESAVSAGDAVTATATAADGSTSEFSQCFVVSRRHRAGRLRHDDRAGHGVPDRLDRQHADLHVHGGRRRDGHRRPDAHRSGGMERALDERDRCRATRRRTRGASTSTGRPSTSSGSRSRAASP